MLRKFIFVVTLCALLPAYADQSTLAEVAPNASVVDLAGQQRMLSQRIVKAYIQIGLELQPELARMQRDDAIEHFEENLEALGTRIGNRPEVTRAHQNLLGTWRNFQRAASGPASRDAALVLSRHSLLLLDEADHLTKLVEQTSKDVVSEAVNQAGMLRMLSQRLAKVYLLLSWGIEDQGLRDELESTVKRMPEQIAALMARAENTPEIRAELEEVELQWTWLQIAILAGGTTTYRLVVVEAADSMLAAADHITRLYAQTSPR